MKALVTGAGGQLGQVLQSGQPAGWTVIAANRASLDITDEAAVRALVLAQRPDLIINAAAYTAVDRAESDAEAAFAINERAAGLLAACATEVGARMVHISTDFVFDGTASRPYAVDAAVSPLGVYGASKAKGEAAVLAAASNALVVRTAWVYAAHGANFMRTMLRLMAERPSVSVVSDQIGSPSHALSLSCSIWALALTDARGVLHATDAGVASWYDFAVAIGEEAAQLGLLPAIPDVRPIRTEDFPTPAKRPAYSVLDKTPTWALIGPARHWRAELRAALMRLKELNG
jgi:dTDP-4-dehydrorhamnose reductase